jgi:hypothetical protein
MNDLDDLHDVLQDRERHAPDADAVRARLTHDLGAGRDRRFAWYAIPATAAAAVVAVASASMALSATHHRVGNPAAGETGSASIRSSAASSSSPLELAWRFDVAPVPGYVFKRLQITRTDQAADVSVPGAGKSIGEIDVFAEGALDATELTRGDAVTVNGRPGYFGLFHMPDASSTGPGKPALGWQYADGAWAVVNGDWGFQPGTETYDLSAARAAEQVVANAVDTSGSEPFLVDYTLGWLPPGLTVEQVSDTFGLDGTPVVAVGFGAGHPGVSGKAAYAGSALTVSRVPASPDSPVNTTVAGKPAFYDSRIGLVVHFPDSTDLVIEVDPMHADTFSEADLIAIATHVSFAPDRADRSTWVPGAQAIPQ